MEISRETIPGRVEKVTVSTDGPWYRVAILDRAEQPFVDGEPRTVWKFPDEEQAKAKAAEVKRWLAEGKLW